MEEGEERLFRKGEKGVIGEILLRRLKKAQQISGEEKGA